MKATLEFALPEDQDALDQALRGSKAVMALTGFLAWLRAVRKHRGLDGVDARAFADEAWDELHRILQEEGIEEIVA